MTCDHVAKGRTRLIYRGVGQSIERSHTLKLSASLPLFDLALLSTEEDVCRVLPPLGDIRRIRPGDRIFYRGFKVEARAIDANTAFVRSVVLSNAAASLVEHLDFLGVGKPGFSRGPVFDTSGNVKAIMRKAFTQRSDLLVVMDAENLVPFRARGTIVTEKDRIVAGIMLEDHEIHPANDRKRFTAKASINEGQVTNEYIELRFRYESIYSAELGNPPELEAETVARYRLEDGKVYPW